MSLFRKSGLAAVAFAVAVTSGVFAPMNTAEAARFNNPAVTSQPATNASGYGYYSPNNGYYNYACRWVKYRVWTYGGWVWKRRKVCN